jgi:regulator of replication initiation timing
MSDDLVTRLRNTPNWKREEYGNWKDATSVYDRAPFEAADEIERLREANKWLDGARLNVWPELRKRAERAEAERDELRKDVKQHFVRNKELRAENEALRAALAGVVGLVELVSSRDDLPTGLDDLMRLSHRMTDAYAALREGK